jgi:hypothetical protein
MPERLKQNVAAFLHPSDRRLKHTRPEDWSHDVWTVVGKILRDHRVSQRRTSLLLVNREGLCVVSELIMIHEFDSFGLVFSPPLCARAGTLAVGSSLLMCMSHHDSSLVSQRHADISTMHLLPVTG